MLHAIALYDCVADEEGELSFTEGTRFVEVADSSEGGWLEGRIEGTSVRGLFPNNYVDVFAAPPPPRPTVAKPIPKTCKLDSSQSTSISPPNSAISSSWSVISNNVGNNITRVDNENNNASSNNGYNVPLKAMAKSDAFDSGLYPSSSTKYIGTTSTVLNKRAPGQSSTITSNGKTLTPVETNEPPNIVSKSVPSLTRSSKLPETKNGFVIPPLRPVPHQQQKEQPLLYTRARSSSSPAPKADVPSSHLVKPSSLRQESLIKTQADTAWRNKQNEDQASTTGAFRRPSLGVTTSSSSLNDNSSKDGTVIASASCGNEEDDVEEEDGYQLIKPSQLRKRLLQEQGQKQQEQPPPWSYTGKNITQRVNVLPASSKSTSLSSSGAVASSLSSTQTRLFTTSTRLETLPSSSTLDKLPSRPVSTANRKAKAKSISSRSEVAKQSAKDGAKSKTMAPAPKPKPAQLNSIAKLSAAPLSSTDRPAVVTKERSASNPPAVQPKVLFNDTCYPKKPTLESKPVLQHTIRPGPPLSIKPGSRTNPSLITNIPRGAVALPGLGKKNSAPTLPTRPSAISGSIGDEGTSLKDKLEFGATTGDTNVKPSQLLTQRARSSTNPNFTTNTLDDFANKTRPITKVLGDGAIRSPPPPPPSSTLSASRTMSSVTSASASGSPSLSNKQPPPPPPPSRQYGHRPSTSNDRNRSNVTCTSVKIGSRTRYDELFDLIQDDGYVDGMTVRAIWNKSRLSSNILADIWQKCDQQKSGLLDRQRFVDGMTQIDSVLLKHAVTAKSTLPMI